MICVSFINSNKSYFRRKFIPRFLDHNTSFIQSLDKSTISLELLFLFLNLLPTLGLFLMAWMSGDKLVKSIISSVEFFIFLSLYHLIFLNLVLFQCLVFLNLMLLHLNMMSLQCFIIFYNFYVSMILLIESFELF